MAYTRQKTKNSKTSFYYSFLFLPKKKRDAIFTVYSFCRESDDIVDSAENIDEARQRLDVWRGEVDACFNHKPQHPIMKALHEVLEDFSMPASYFHQLIDGCEMDLAQDRYETFEDLRNYCYHVASIVGLICIEIFGYRTPQTKDYAVNLGLALQITNILRDVGEDAQRGRIYLPQEDLERFKCSENDLIQENYNDAFVALMEHEARRAQSFFDRAIELYEHRDHDLLFPAEIMRKIYYALLNRIIASRFHVFHERIRVPNMEKMRYALESWLSSRWRSMLQWAPIP